MEKDKEGSAEGEVEGDEKGVRLRIVWEERETVTTSG